MSTPPTGSPAPLDPRLPEPLIRQMRAFEGRLRRLETVTAAGGAVLGLAITFGLLYLSDRVWETPGWLRLLLSVGGAAAVSWGSVYWFKRWVVAKRGPRELARMIQDGFPEMGDRLLGVVELTDGGPLPEGVSPALVRAAIAQVGRQAEKVNFQEAAPARLPHRVATVCAVLVTLAAVPFVVAPNAAKNALQRLLNPLGDVRRFTFVSLEDMPDRLVVPHGEPFPLTARVAADSERKPDSASARFEDQPPLQAPFTQGVAAFEIPGQTREGGLELKAGDVTKRIRVTPAHRPELVELSARVTLPEYLARPPETKPVNGSTAALLEGSLVSFTGKVSRDVRSATVRESPDLALTLKEKTFSTPEQAARGESTLTFAWTDKDGLNPAQPFKLRVETFADAKPEVDFRDVNRTLAILPEEVAELPVRAEDDFGLKTVEVKWRAARADGKPEEGPAPAGGEPVGAGSPTTQRVDGKFTFSPLIAKVGESQVVTVEAVAKDYHPSRGAAVSQPVKIFVLNHAQHAKMVQEMMERLLARVEELAREEENLQQAHEAMAMKSTPELAKAEAGQQAKEGQQMEERNRRNLEELAREAEKVMKEAMRNKDIPEKTLTEFNQMASDMKDVAEGQMQEASESLAAAAQKPQDRKKEIAKAAEKEKEAVKKLREMEKRMDRSIENMVAQSFVNRLRAAAALEKAVATDLAAAVPEILGQLPEEMAPDKQDFVKQVSERQFENRRKAGAIQDDLGGFFNRTRKEEYGSVYQEMIDRKTTAALEQLTQHIAENLAGKSIPGAQRWDKQFTDWADALEAANKQDGEGQEGESQEQMDLETLIALMRARYLEEGIREQTRLLEETKAQNAVHGQDAKRLAKSQFGVGDTVSALENRIKDDKLRQLATKVSGEMMNAGTLLREPRTDQETIGIQTEIIEMLSSLISQSKGGKSSAGKSMMMAMGMSPNGGGSLAGGDTNRRPTAAQGAGNALSPEERATRKGSGLDAGVPEEFRDAMETFFNGLESAN